MLEGAHERDQAMLSVAGLEQCLACSGATVDGQTMGFNIWKVVQISTSFVLVVTLMCLDRQQLEDICKQQAKGGEAESCRMNWHVETR